MKTSPFMISVEGLSLTDRYRRLLEEISPYSVILFSENYENPAQLKKLIRDIKLYGGDDIEISIDHEGGRVVRFIDLPMISAFEMGKLSDHKVYQIAKENGRKLADLGITMNLAPVADLDNINAHQVMKNRCFSSDPVEVSQKCIAFIEGMSSESIKCVLKHFPGSGDAVLDPHIDLPNVNLTKEQLKDHLRPFQVLIDHGLQYIMTSHIRFPKIDPNYPATFSRLILNHILRDEMKFKGTLITDDLKMAAISKKHGIEDAITMAKNAGNDILLICNDFSAQQVALNQLVRVKDNNSNSIKVN